VGSMRGLCCLLLALFPALLQGQSLELIPDQPKANIGDLITLRLTVHLPEGMELLDLAPRTLLAPPDGMRIVSTDTLRRYRSGEYRCAVRMAFYRVGRQPVPTLALLYRPAPGASPDTLVHAPLAIEIVPILPAGNQEIKDIRPLRLLGGPGWAPLVLILVAVLAGAFWLVRRARVRGGSVGALRLAIPVGPFEVALARLTEMEQASIASGNGVAPLFGEVAELVRNTLVEVGALPHQGLTTPEVPEKLPLPFGADDLADRCVRLLYDADLVKFARVRPDRLAATSHVAQARSLLEAWRDRAGATHAVR